MSLSKSTKWIPAVYIGLALWAVAAILASVLLAFTPVAHVAHTADLGPQGVPALHEGRLDGNGWVDHPMTKSQLPSRSNSRKERRPIPRIVY